MAQASRLLRLTLVVILLLATFAIGWTAAMFGVGRAVPRRALTDLERQFSDRMRGATLVGRFTVAGREDQPANPDRYEIARAEKVGADRWRFDARIKYGSVDVTVPVAVTMLWAGDTPMITMTDVTIPTLGTFTVRLFFYGDRYAGVWQHGPRGGAMFGRIEKGVTPP